MSTKLGRKVARSIDKVGDGCAPVGGIDRAASHRGDVRGYASCIASPVPDLDVGVGALNGVPRSTQEWKRKQWACNHQDKNVPSTTNTVEGGTVRVGLVAQDTAARVAVHESIAVCSLGGT